MICTKIDIEKITTRPTKQWYDGFYASVHMDDGWDVECWGQTENEAKAALIIYVTGGKYVEDRNS